jgi:hypothetical protein
VALWQANNLDSDSDKGILEALIHGTAYTLVQPNGTDTPDIWIEHPSQTIVAYEAGTNRRKKAAGLKLWVDDWTGSAQRHAVPARLGLQVRRPAAQDRRAAQEPAVA